MHQCRHPGSRARLRWHNRLCGVAHEPRLASLLQPHQELIPALTGTIRCLALPPAGEHHNRESWPHECSHALTGFASHADSPKRPVSSALANLPSLF